MFRNDFLQARFPINGAEAIGEKIERPSSRRFVLLRRLHRKHHREQHESARFWRIGEARLHDGTTVQRCCLRISLPHNGSRFASLRVVNFRLILSSGCAVILRHPAAEAA